MIIARSSKIIDGNDTTDWVSFDVSSLLAGSVHILPSDAWATATFNVKWSPDGTVVNAQEFASAVDLTAAAPFKKDIDLSSIEHLIIEVDTAEGSALRAHVVFDGKAPE